MRAKRPDKHKKHIFLKFMAALAVACAAIIASSELRLTVTSYSVGGAPESGEGFRIVQLSDLHGRDFGERLLRKVSSLEPDIIALTGDFINSSSASEGCGQSEKLRELLTELPRIAPCYFVSGNHEWASHEYDDLRLLLSDCGIVCLDNDSVPLRDGLTLVGVADPNGPADMEKPDALISRVRAERPDDFIVLLAHRNYWPERYPELDVQLILCGHGHGGIIRIPGVGGLIGTGGDFFPEFDAGAYRSGSYVMIVSRGLGNGVSMPRFFNPPELVVAELHTETETER